MVSIETIASITIKILKLVINFIILILYRTGYAGEFLGIGGQWNLNEDKNPDVEIVGSGVFVGFFLYTGVVLITFCFGTTNHKKSLVDIIMNFLGLCMFLAVGGTALHYWHGYQPEHKFEYLVPEKEVGLALGSLCIIEGVLYLLDLLLSVRHLTKEEYD
ncbi:protein snakeskin-like [Vespa mandarinia]|uniref:protein snakeskin-like n=1 Tax=Vespa mandarinia TaxID=7446 RepID=UPI001607A1BB|nr:protein snakeskin-like [Vespa mandarinia]XP_046821093.1 protein snakeskin [Vespa crabro]